ncbi:PilN domain-containing protein [Pedobacter sp. MC2016-14]|uniref:PilN domain-containing protein n=1 Tax=Pedobacter sp. MC2016-14 TaxID=2897327 RepID=UPI001E54626E|nr:PilN domain-containing protein [Pedobacter sp. MC2016-14]MCD0487353.1 PilN domain-containing protein [Pedobacter sp. MC2016-14]
MAFSWKGQKGLSGCAGAEVFIKADGTFELRLLHISLQASQLLVESKKEYTVSLDKILPEELKAPLAITLTGRGVLIKKTGKLDLLSEQNLQHLFPNLKLAEFYVQHFVSGGTSYVAIVRREVADAILKAFKKQGATVMLMSLGPFVADQVLPQLNSYNGNLNFDGHQVSLNQEKEWQDYTYTPGLNAGFTLKIDIEVMPEQFILAYATAFQLLLHERLELIEVETEGLAEQLAEYTAKLKFKRNSMLVLGGIFVLLLLNFLVFSHYNAANEEMAGRAGQQTSVTVNKEKMEADVKEKEAMVKNLGWNKGLPYAYLCDQLGQTVPGTITLTELTVNNLLTTGSSLLKESLAEPFTVRLKGQAENVYVLNDWMYVLKQKPWIKKVQLEKYLADEQQQTQVFTLILNF